MRAFFGIGLPAGVRDSIVSAVAGLRGFHAPVSWTPAENLHITLKFLGEISADRLPGIEESLRPVAAAIPPFSLLCEGGGVFPGERNPRIFHVGFLEPLELVRRLQQNMENALSGAGFPREDRPFHPHITVGRTRGALPPGLGGRYLHRFSGRRFGVVPVSSFTLYRSRLTPGGAVYSPWIVFPLGGEDARKVGEENRT
ncbi:MAG: RNA 2',3'-cyclic phosphodiesterase [Deltaproteobacteria bacterium]